MISTLVIFANKKSRPITSTYIIYQEQICRQNYTKKPSDEVTSESIILPSILKIQHQYPNT
jgi:hypothetical protein